MTEFLILIIIITLLFGNDKVKEIARVVFTAFVSLCLVGVILSNPLSIELFHPINLLLLIVLYILFFGADKFKRSSSLAMTIVLGLTVCVFVFGNINFLQSGT